MRSELSNRAGRRKKSKHRDDGIRTPTFEELGESPAIGMLPDGTLNIVGYTEDYVPDGSENPELLAKRWK